MFNVAIVNIKHIVIYLILMIIVSILFFSIVNLGKLINKSSYNEKIYSETETSADTVINFFNYSTILSKTIPGIEEYNNSNNPETDFLESKNILQTLLATSLPIMTSTVYLEDSDESQVTSTQDEPENNVQHAETNVTTEVISSNVPNKYTNDYNGVEIKNGTNYALTEDMLNPSSIEINKNDIIIFHTHTCESYTPTENYQYEASGTFRTIDLNFSVSRVGDELSNQLLSYGYNVIHDTTYHDYPAYSGSYGRSMATVENLLLSHGQSDIIIDLHRDAIADMSYAPSVKIGDETVAQLMFVIGTDGGGLEHPNWQENLKFTIKLQQKANELYPGLFRPILISNSRYNQHLGKAACIIEVGATRKYFRTGYA